VDVVLDVVVEDDVVEDVVFVLLEDELLVVVLLVDVLLVDVVVELELVLVVVVVVQHDAPTKSKPPLQLAHTSAPFDVQALVPVADTPFEQVHVFSHHALQEPVLVRE
jgi:hypothetical protein